MFRAVELARRGSGRVNPNPLVGAVLVKDGVLIGEGWHDCFGGAHAERNAFDQAGGIATCAGADLYVTLEPCCHTGKQPPCTEVIIAARIRRVFIGSRDPNPQVNGNGISVLRDAGIDVYTDVLRAECDALNAVFFHYITTKTPYVIMKYAMSADGQTACYTGSSQWVTGEAARACVHEERAQYMAVMTGVQTVIADDPLLTCRAPQLQGARMPVRIVCDTELRIPLSCRLVQTARDYPLIVACAAPRTDGQDTAEYTAKKAALEAAGVTVIAVPRVSQTDAGDGIPRIDLRALMAVLGARGIDSIVLESGGTLNGTALECGIVQRVQVFVAPALFGTACNGTRIFTPVRGCAAVNPCAAIRLSAPRIRTFADDVLLEYDVIPA